MATPSRSLNSTSLFSEIPPLDVIFGETEAMRVVKQKVESAASTLVPVLVRGESGTGKEIISKLLHIHSPWRNGPFVKVNCPAIPGTLIESELFGYERGAFTGANVSKPGRVEAAQSGSLFLDEIGDLDMSLQAKLLQVLQDGRFCRIGATEDTVVNTRVISATNRDLSTSVNNGSFRQDLFYRINVVDIVLPSLRERTEDIPRLAEYFITVYNQRFGRSVENLSMRALRRMQSHAWSGNIRELENVIRRYVILGDENIVLAELYKTSSAPFVPDIPLDTTVSLKKITRDAVHEIERRVILRVLQANHWNRKRTARALGISYRALLYKLRGSGLTEESTVDPVFNESALPVPEDEQF